MKWHKNIDSDVPEKSGRCLIAIKNELQDDPLAVTFEGFYSKPANKFIIPGLHDYVMLAWMELPEYVEPENKMLEVDEDSLNSLAENYVKSVYGDDWVDFIDLDGEGFKAGYKARMLEEHQ